MIAAIALLLTPAGVYVAMLAGMQAMLVLGCATFVLPAPMGKWGPRSSRLSLNANLGWVLMEIPGPICLLLAMGSVPSAPPLAWSPSLLNPSVGFGSFVRLLFPGLLGHETGQPFIVRWWTNFCAHSASRQAAAIFYLVHYLHRALIQPLLRAPRRTPMALEVPLSAMMFQTSNGFLIGTWLASRAPQSLPPSLKVTGTKWLASFDSAGTASLAPSAPGPSFWLWLVLAALGLASNIFHDEVLLSLRRPQTPAKGPTVQVGKHTYSIPTGGLFTYIDHPHYLSEWLEWAFWGVAVVLHTCPAGWGWLSCPPTLFPLVEVAVMLPRAVRGHEWYKTKFGELYPAQRRAVVPFVL